MNRRLPMAAGVVFAMGWPLVLAAFVPSQNLRDVREDVAILTAEWLSVAVLYAIVVGWERRPFFSTVGWLRPKRTDYVLVAAIALVAAASCLFVAKHPPSAPLHNTILEQILGVPLPLRAAIVFTAGICEETLFRGYALERLRILTGNVWTGAAIATVLFTLGHLPRYGFTPGLLGVAGIGALLALVYIWRRNLIACVALHWLIDGYPLLIVPTFVTLR